MRARPATALAAAALLACGALAGCGGAGTTKAAAEATPPQLVAPRASLVTANLSNAEIYGQQAATAPIRAEAQTASLPPPSPAAQPEAKRLPPASADHPRKLVGFDRAALEAALGQPAIQRPEGKAELWQYRAANCVLDVFLYAGKDGRLRVTHTDLRGRRDNRGAPQGCFADIVAAGDKRAQTAETKPARN